jgi:hypothetical protein
MGTSFTDHFMQDVIMMRGNLGTFRSRVIDLPGHAVPRTLVYSTGGDTDTASPDLFACCRVEPYSTQTGHQRLLKLSLDDHDNLALLIFELLGTSLVGKRLN